MGYPPLRASSMKQPVGHKACGLYAHVTWHTWRRVPQVRQGDVPVVLDAVLSAAARTACVFTRKRLSQSTCTCWSATRQTLRCLHLCGMPSPSRRAESTRPVSMHSGCDGAVGTMRGPLVGVT